MEVGLDEKAYVVYVRFENENLVATYYSPKERKRVKREITLTSEGIETMVLESPDCKFKNFDNGLSLWQEQVLKRAHKNALA